MSEPEPGLDSIGAYIARLHGLAGHDVAARLLGSSFPPGSCMLCAFEASPTPERKAAVIAALQPAGPTRVCWHALPYCSCPPGTPKRKGAVI